MKMRRQEQPDVHARVLALRAIDIADAIGEAHAAGWDWLVREWSNADS
jgi:hypothetical protein